MRRRVGAVGETAAVMWELAHRRREDSEATRVVIETATSAEAIEQLRPQLPPEHVILYVMLVDRSEPSATSETPPAP